MIGFLRVEMAPLCSEAAAVAHPIQERCDVSVLFGIYLFFAQTSYCNLSRCLLLQCQPGFGVNCTVCPAGTYQNGVPSLNATGSALPCQACPDGKTSVPGATDVTQCYCPPGKLAAIP
jgi:hypothetical protein